MPNADVATVATAGGTLVLWRGSAFASVIGIDLSSRRAYNEEARLAYHLPVVGRWMCGNNDSPGTAGKVMERLNNA